MIKKYKKQPIVIEACQWTGNNLQELYDFCGTKIKADHVNSEEPLLYIHTLEGTMEGSIDDYIIKGIDGEFYACKPTIFEKTYEEVDENVTLGSLYDINKQLAKQQRWLRPDDIRLKKKLIDKFIKESNANYFMLLSDELKYYTTFIVNNIDNTIIADEVVDCIESNHWKIISIAQDGDKIEIWAGDDDNAYLFYLFEYNWGVIIC